MIEEKTLWEKEKLLEQAISPFPTIFSKGFFPRPVKRCHCVGMGYSFTTQFRLLITPSKKSFENILGKGENAGNQDFLLFSQCFQPYHG